MPETLSPQEIYRACDLGSLSFETTSDISPEAGTIGQERAMRAIDFGLSLESKGFNIYVLGASGTGRTTTIRNELGARAESEPVPDDWCYVYNFKDADVPLTISMKPGTAATFQRDMEDLVNSLKVDIPKVFESKEYEKSRSAIFEGFQKKQKDLFGSLEEEVKAKGFSIRKTVSGLLIVPVNESGEPLTEEAFEELDSEKKQRIEEQGRHFQEKLDDVVRTVREEEKHLKKLLGKLDGVTDG